ncbi:MAG TPA: SPFH domain-containing protein [Candidatus Saccharibacteria bacterium]|jgi:regulator of protease activity HflC (stomatin/prohibitin superfamily)|nr:SPFH domain-containing protein [Candidatus Saccharibacteria bacterium]HMT55946.1 SPFH domain-containing protein [Candidatus Saccharibacteria bacterium]
MNPEIRSLVAFNLADSGVNAVTKIAGLVAVAFGTLIIKSAVGVISDGEVGIVKHNGRLLKSDGRPYGSVGRGLHPKLPFITTFEKVDMKQRETILPEIEVMLTSGIDPSQRVQKSIGATAFWRLRYGDDKKLGIPEFYKPHLRIKDGIDRLETVVSSVVTEGIRRTAEATVLEEFNTNTLYPQIREYTATELHGYGVALCDIKIGKCVDTPAQVIANGLQASPTFLNPTVLS